MNDTQPTFQEALDFLLDESQDIHSGTLFRYTRLFSDHAPAQLKSLLKVWDEILLSRRHSLLAHLKSELEIDLIYSFDVLARPLLNDDDAIIRIFAIRLLEDYESEDLVPTFLEIATNDPEIEPRAEAISLLGFYIYYGELEEISQKSLKRIEETLLQIVQHDEKAKLRQRAIEALGFSSRKEVPALIKEAWQREAAVWKASAVFAMGRSYDSVWEEEILEGLLDESELVRLAATKAAGSLSLASARPILLRVLTEEKDEIVLKAAIWSLSQIGGEDVREYLLALLDQYEDDEKEQVEYLEEALANLDFTEDIQQFDILNYDSEGEI